MPSNKNNTSVFRTSVVKYCNEILTFLQPVPSPNFNIVRNVCFQVGKLDELKCSKDQGTTHCCIFTAW